MTEKKGLSLKLKLLLALVASLLLAALVFYAVSEIGSFLVWRYYLGEADKQERAEEYVAKFQKYVTENKLTTDDAEKISSWNPGGYVDFIVYKDSNLLYAPEWFEEFGVEESESESVDISEDTELESESAQGDKTEDSSGSESETIADKSFYEKWFLGDRGFEQYLTEEARKNYVAALDDALGDDNARYPVYFVDGTLIVAVVDFGDEYFSNVVLVASIIVALMVVTASMIIYFGTITRRISLLQRNVRIIEKGDLEHKIAQSGNDEIALLARDVESMRDSIVDNMTRERRAWEANAGLITAMSHDVRTPLTVLLGYLDLIEMQNDGKINEEYISACRDNAMRLKNLSDDMFSYFLVFGKSEGELNLTKVDAGQLVEHVISEYTLLLSENGYSFEPRGELPEVSIEIEERYFKRVIDNIFSNIIKYADARSPIVLGARCSDDALTFYCENKVRTDKDIPESNGIGLRTCVKMMEEMGGKMSFGERNGTFAVALTFPLCK